MKPSVLITLKNSIFEKKIVLYVSGKLFVQNIACSICNQVSLLYTFLLVYRSLSTKIFYTTYVMKKFSCAAFF